MAENEKSISFRISKLEDLGYTFQKPEGSVPTERIDFSMKNNLDIAVDESKIKFILHPKFTTGKRETKLIVELIFNVEFNVQGIEQFLDEEDDETINLPDQLIVTLFSISYSTMRGFFLRRVAERWPSV